MCYDNVLTTLAMNSVTIKYKEHIKLMRRQLTSVSQEIIKVINFREIYKECYKIF